MLRLNLFTVRGGYVHGQSGDAFRSVRGLQWRVHLESSGRVEIGGHFDDGVAQHMLESCSSISLSVV